jgi:formiminotetrahydrofolate cyclodeaminase
LIPLKAMTDAGKYFLEKQQRSTGVSERELIKIAIKSMGLDELGPFNPDERIIEYRLKRSSGRLVGMTLTAFADETASESPAPGGGSIAAYLGTLGVSLGTMVANLSSHKKGWDERWKEFSDWADKGQALKDALLTMVDEDTNSFNRIMQAFSLPKGTEEEKKARTTEIQAATRYATEVPFKVMQLSYDTFELIRAMAETGNPNSVTDAGVGALCARSAVIGAYLNVKINASGLSDKAFAADIERLRNGEIVSRLEYTFNNTVKVPDMLHFYPRKILVVEGIFVFHFPEVASLLDLKIFIDAQDKIKLKRRIKRDNEERGYDLQDVMYRWKYHVKPTYEEFIRPHKRSCDIVIPNNQHFEKGLDVIVSYLKNQI